jgi:hypothetical protein
MKKHIVLATIIMLLLSMFFSVTSRVTVSAGSNVSSVGTPLSGLSQGVDNKQPLVRGYQTPLDPSSEANTTSQYTGYWADGWQDGSIYPPSLPIQNATSVAASIDVPNIPPLFDELYYVLLSVVDSNGSYDQIGLCANYGTWTLLYSWTAGPPSQIDRYHTDFDAMNLSQGTTYTFSITAEGGVAYFAAYEGSTNVWNEENVTGGYYLMLNNTDPYWGNGYADYTCYEEVFYTNLFQGAPAFNFYFHNQYWLATNGSVYFPSWTDYSYAAPGYPLPNGINVLLDGGDVYIWNPGVVPSQYPVSVGISNVDPLPPHYSVVQIYNNGMLMDGQNTWNSYNVTVSRTDNDTSVSSLCAQVGLEATNVNNASDYRVIDTGFVWLGPDYTQPCNCVWNETSTMDPGAWSITGFVSVLSPNNTLDLNPSDNQLTNGTFQTVELLGDINLDGSVNVLDSILLGDAFGSHCANYDYQGEPASPNWNVNADLNLDGTVNVLDAILLSDNFGQNVNGSGDDGSSSLNGGVQPAAAGNPSIAVDPGQVTVFKGEVFAVNVIVTNVTDLQGWEFQLYWNSTVLNCTNAAVVTPPVWQGYQQDYGPGLQPNYNSTCGMFSEAEAAEYPAPPFNGSTTVATLTFQALQPGTTSLTLADALLGDSTAQPISCTVSSGSVTVYMYATLSISVSGAGTTSPAPGNYSYSYGTNVTVTATPSSGYAFSYWSLDGTDYYGNPITVTMTANNALTAHFVYVQGGCVLYNTSITMADGKTVPVQTVKLGDQIIGYDVQTGTFVTETVTSNNCTTVDEVLSINNGLLYVTPTDQPIYTDHGWVINPQDIMIGWKIYNPTTNTWITVQSVRILEGNFRVYDLQATQPNTFIGNGILLDRKT